MVIKELAQECYFTTVKEVDRVEEDSEEHNKIPKLELEEEFEQFILDVKKPEQTVKIGKHLPIDLRMQLAKILVEYKDIFAWSSSNLGMVPLDIAEHKLDILEGIN